MGRNIQQGVTAHFWPRVCENTSNLIYPVEGLIDGITKVILSIMKTAISIPDEVFEAAERAAKKLGVSRSELYANAVREFVERYGRDGITEMLNDVYTSIESNIDKPLEQMQLSSIPREEW